jgi:hypothetical protein
MEARPTLLPIDECEEWIWDILDRLRMLLKKIAMISLGNLIYFILGIYCRQIFLTFFQVLNTGSKVYVLTFP